MQGREMVGKPEEHRCLMFNLTVAVWIETKSLFSLKFSLKSAGHIGFRDLSSTLDTTKREEVLNSITGLIWVENGQQE